MIDDGVEVPVDFITAEQHQHYGRFSGDPTPDQLAKFFHLDKEDRDFVRGSLGRALQLGTVRFLGTFLSDAADVPETVAAYVALQLNELDAACVLAAYRGSQMIRIHAREIREEYGYRDFTEATVGFRFLRWLYARTWGSTDRASALFDLAAKRLIDTKVLLPGLSTLSRLVSRVRDRAAIRLWERLDRIPTTEERERLLGLLLIPDGARQTEFDRLRRAPTTVSTRGLIGALQRLRDIRALGVGGHDISRTHPGRLAALIQFTMKARAQAIERLNETRRVATLLAFARGIETRACDDAVDIFDQVLRRKRSEAKRARAKSRLETLPDLDTSALKLAAAARIFLDPSHDSLEVKRAAVYEVVPERELAAAADAVEGIAKKEDDDPLCKYMTAHYQSLRRFVPLLAETIEFDGTEAATPVVDAWNGLRGIERRKILREADVHMKAVPTSWRPHVLEPTGLVNREAYTVCLVERLWRGLQRRELFAKGSKRWGDPRGYLIPAAIWPSERANVCRALSLPTTPDAFIARLREELDSALHLTADQFAENVALRIEERDGEEKLVLTPLEAEKEPESLTRLRARVDALMPHVDVPDVILEVATWTGFPDDFTHVSESKSRVEDLSTSVCAVLLAEACNVGLGPVSRQGQEALRRGRLSWVTQNFVRHDTLRRANTRLVNFQATIPLARAWGGGDVATVDGIRFVVPSRSINAGPNPKYFGKKRGVTDYNYANNQLVGFHHIVVPGTMRDSLFILDGLLGHDPDLVVRPKELIADNAGYSDLVFGLFLVEGFQFSPSIADISDARVWRFDRAANYGVLDGVARHHLNEELFRSSWDDILRVAGSLSQLRVHPSELVRVLQADGRPTALGRAIAELGRVPKTLQLLRLVGDEAYRRHIRVNLNRHEGRHGLARELFHGKRGELRQKYREGQEDQLGALGLVINAIVLWNTRYMDAVLQHLRDLGEEVRPEDVAHLSPLGYDHINLAGNYHFGIPDAVRGGALRPFRDPKEITL